MVHLQMERSLHRLGGLINIISVREESPHCSSHNYILLHSAFYIIQLISLIFYSNCIIVTWDYILILSMNTII